MHRENAINFEIVIKKLINFQLICKNKCTHSISQSSLYRRGQHYRRYDQNKNQERHVEKTSCDGTFDFVAEATQPTGGGPKATAQQIQTTHSEVFTFSVKAIEEYNPIPLKLSIEPMFFYCLSGSAMMSHDERYTYVRT